MKWTSRGQPLTTFLDISVPGLLSLRLRFCLCLDLAFHKIRPNPLRSFVYQRILEPIKGDDMALLQFEGLLH